MNEFDIIARYFTPLTFGAEGTFSLKDDAAFLSSAEMGKSGLVVTTDCLVAGQHFFAEDRAEDIAIKVMGVNLSDIAAKGALPYRYQLSLVLPKEKAVPEWLDGFAKGLRRVQKETGCLLLGGDTVGANGPLTLSVTMMGKPCGDHMVRRAGAQMGDIILVSGTIGDAVIGLALRTGDFSGELASLERESKDYFLNRYLYPGPRTGLASLIARYASAAMDISDGLVGDLKKLCVASGVSALIDLDKIPVASPLLPLIKAHPGLFQRLISGGDDYEILLTVPPSDLSCLLQEAEGQGAEFFQIGIVGPAGGGGQTLNFSSSSTDSTRKISLSSGGSFDHFG